MKITMVSILLSLLTGCGYGYKIDPTERCDGVIVAKDNWNDLIKVAYTYNKQYYVATYSLWDDDTSLLKLHDGEKVKVYAWDGNVEGIEK